MSEAEGEGPGNKKKIAIKASSSMLFQQGKDDDHQVDVEKELKTYCHMSRGVENEKEDFESNPIQSTRFHFEIELAAQVLVKRTNGTESTLGPGAEKRFNLFQYFVSSFRGERRERHSKLDCLSQTFRFSLASSLSLSSFASTRHRLTGYWVRNDSSTLFPSIGFFVFFFLEGDLLCTFIVLYGQVTRKKYLLLFVSSMIARINYLSSKIFICSSFPFGFRLIA